MGISSSTGDYGRCAYNGIYPNDIKRKSFPALFRQHFPLGLTFNNQNNNNDESEYPSDENKFLY